MKDQFDGSKLEQIRAVLDERGYGAYGKDGEVRLLADEVRLGGNFLIEVIDVARRWKASGRLSLRPFMRKIVVEAFDLVPQYACSVSAINLLMEDIGNAGLYFDALKPSDLIPYIESHGRAGEIGLSAYGEALQQQQRGEQYETSLRAKIIQNITNGKPTYSAFSKIHGQVRQFNSAELETMSTGDLRAVEAAVMGYRQRRDGDVGGPQEAAESNAPAADRWLTENRGLQTTAPAPKNVPVIADDEFLACPSDPSREYTRKELVNMRPADLKNLILCGGQQRSKARSNAISRILQGRRYGQ